MADDLVIPALKVALDGLAQRQRVIATNVANIQTPGYQAQNVDFESALQSAMSLSPNASISDLSSTITQSGTGDPSREDGNNVNLDRETLLGSKTNLQYSLALKAIDGRFQTMRDVVKGV